MVNYVDASWNAHEAVWGGGGEGNGEGEWRVGGRSENVYRPENKHGVPHVNCGLY